MKKENTLFSPIILYIIIITLFYYDYDCTIEYECVLCVCVCYLTSSSIYILCSYMNNLNIFLLDVVHHLPETIDLAIDRTNEQTNKQPRAHFVWNFVPCSSD